MSNLFYYIGFLFILECIAELTIWRKQSIEELLGGLTLGNIINSVKNLRGMIMGLLFFIWILIGAFYAETTELKWLFKIEIGFAFISGLIPECTKGKKQKIIIFYTTNIISILFITYIILRHFNLLQW